MAKRLFIYNCFLFGSQCYTTTNTTTISTYTCHNIIYSAIVHFLAYPFNLLERTSDLGRIISPLSCSILSFLLHIPIPSSLLRKQTLDLCVYSYSWNKLHILYLWKCICKTSFQRYHIHLIWWIHEPIEAYQNFRIPWSQHTSLMTMLIAQAFRRDLAWELKTLP